MTSWTRSTVRHLLIFLLFVRSTHWQTPHRAPTSRVCFDGFRLQIPPPPITSHAMLITTVRPYGSYKVAYSINGNLAVPSAGYMARMIHLATCASQCWVGLPKRQCNPPSFNVTVSVTCERATTLTSDKYHTFTEPNATCMWPDPQTYIFPQMM
jgi:hypothetical protein